MTTQFVLFDIDGVLLKPVGYRRAIFDTCDYFLTKFGQNSFSIDEEIITTFESIGITSEWDMVPLIMLNVIDLGLSLKRPNNYLETEEDIIKFFKSSNFHLNRYLLISEIQKLKNYLRIGNSACEAILLSFTDQQSDPIFANILKYAEWIIYAWLSETRNIFQSNFLQYFQNLTLGNLQFENITGLKPIVETEPYLLIYDQPLLEKHVRQSILEMCQKNNMYPGIITARPSLFPGEHQKIENRISFPEAEFALQCLQLEQVPFIGFGPLEFLGIQKNTGGDSFVKPSSLHALVALLVSSGLTMHNALLLSFDFLYNQHFKEMKNYFSKFETPIHATIFEDSTIGIQSLRSVCEKLSKIGINIEMHAFGISDQPNKINALKNENAVIFPTLNEAFSSSVDLISN